ncbi:substrate-binding domain-containing protein [Haloferula sp. A504]|uniref:substrate-binding domain-containing protein n=1 Tax=Haloferula sp. A504 TaxID=3373601 RepID=UPI0031C30476|nr:substrate-binding domain-containing protein [Verrucomicrobiaceae bacterium E54]
MTRAHRILIYTDLEHTARRQMVQGLGRYAREGHRWQPMIPWADLDLWSLPEGMEVDGVIAFPNTRERIDFLLGLPCPVVCVGPHFSEVKLPRVDWDDVLAGRMAVGHLAGLGMRRIAFVGTDFGLGYVSKRLQGARLAAAEHELDIDALELEPGGHRAGKAAAVTKSAMKWLKGLEPPFGVLAATDITGFDLLNALRSADIAVPEQAAVISIGGDNVLCPFCDPALSSVELPGEQVGYEAAQLLNQLIDKQKPAKELRVPPRRVVARRSSNMVATGDEMVRRALTFIREHASEPIGVGDVLAVVPLSRRPLELRFKRDTGRTLQKEIWRVRLERAKEMLIETDLPVAEIAIRCGFSEPQRMTEVFGRELSVAPGSFRQSHRLTGGSR